MSVFGAIGQAAQIGGGLLNAYGEMQANAKNKGTKKLLGWQVENLRDLADPVGASLTSGYQPGGWLRTNAISMARMPVETELGKTREALRSNAWRYGGSGSGLNGRRWTDAAVKGAMGEADALATGESESMDTLARIDATNRGYDKAFNPETLYGNRYAWVSDMLNQFGQVAGKTGGAGSF